MGASLGVLVLCGVIARRVKNWGVFGAYNLGAVFSVAILLFSSDSPSIKMFHDCFTNVSRVL